MKCITITYIPTGMLEQVERHFPDAWHFTGACNDLSLAEYLEKFYRTESALWTDLFWADRNEKFVSQLRALFLIGFIITNQ